MIYIAAPSEVGQEDVDSTAPLDVGGEEEVGSTARAQEVEDGIIFEIDEQSFISTMADQQGSEIVKLNVGGELFMTTLTTLRQYPGTVLANMFDSDSDRPPAIKVHLALNPFNLGPYT